MKPLRIVLTLAVVAATGVAVVVSASGFDGNRGPQLSPPHGSSPCKIGKRSAAPMPGLALAGGGSTGPVTIGCGRSSDERVEIVAYELAKSFCFGVYRPSRGSLAGGE